jgi:hypothetical protein
VTASKEEALSSRLVISRSKTKYMKVKKNIRNFEPHLIRVGQVLEVVQSFAYAGTLISFKKCNKWRNKLKDCCT